LAPLTCYVLERKVFGALCRPFHVNTMMEKIVGFAYQGKKDIVFRFILEYSSLKGFWPLNNNNNNRSIFYVRIFET